MYTFATRYHDLCFNDKLVSMDANRKRLEIIKSLALLTRYLDVKYETYLHDQFTSWLKRKEIRWSQKNTTNTYALSKTLSIENVVKELNKLPIKYSIFGKFVLTTGLRPEESLHAFNNHSKLCKNGVLELFWDRGTKKANSVFCHPSLHDKIVFPMSRIVYKYINKKEIGIEVRHLRKLNYTINATKIDPLLAEFMQGRRGNVSQRHYFLPMMQNYRKKWIKVWNKILLRTNNL